MPCAGRSGAGPDGAIDRSGRRGGAAVPADRPRAAACAGLSRRLRGRHADQDRGEPAEQGDPARGMDEVELAQHQRRRKPACRRHRKVLIVKGQPMGLVQVPRDLPGGARPASAGLAVRQAATPAAAAAAKPDSSASSDPSPPGQGGAPPWSSQNVPRPRGQMPAPSLSGLSGMVAIGRRSSTPSGQTGSRAALGRSPRAPGAAAAVTGTMKIALHAFDHRHAEGDAERAPAPAAAAGAG